MGRKQKKYNLFAQKKRERKEVRILDYVEVMFTIYRMCFVCSFLGQCQWTTGTEIGTVYGHHS